MSSIKYYPKNSLTETGPYKDLQINCYYSRRVPDPADPRLRDIYYKPPIRPECQASLAVKTASQISPSKDEVYIPAESGTALAFSITPRSRYKVMIYIGGQNICSHAWREHENESHIQDYHVVSGPLAIDGVFVKEGLVRQLVAVESEEPGYSIEHQMTGVDTHLSIQMEFFPERHVTSYTLPVPRCKCPI
jgi:hypothetical protein